ncbi:MAG TPA: ferric siderophore ABC transporter substrate-binding protein [Polyangia bacterium]|nr:ferric siderophore ABC transporter substrate-binding protein [Polyangia bacterium]
MTVRERLRVAELVFAGEPSGRRRRLLAGGVVVAALYGGTALLVGGLGSSGAPLVASLAAKVHQAIAAERTVDVTPPPPPPRPPIAETPSAVKPSSLPRVHARSAPVRSRPAAPAAAGKLAAAVDAPVDFTGTAFVVGSGATYAGGTTMARGTSRTPVSGAVAVGGTGNGSPARSRARAVALDESAWSCPWPAEAEARQVDQETVVLRVAVRADGRAERVDLVDDPGFGFGPAARQCALETRFEPARDPAGAPVAALSPPIRVHFFR